MGVIKEIKDCRFGAGKCGLLAELFPSNPPRPPGLYTRAHPAQKQNTHNSKKPHRTLAERIVFFITGEVSRGTDNTGDLPETIDREIWG